MPFAVLAAFLRLGKKYGIRQLFEEAKKRLSLGCTPFMIASSITASGNKTLFPRISGNDPFNFRVMNVAGEVGLLSQVVVAIFYCCVACPALSIADGYDFEGARCTLSASNQRHCLLAQRYLADVKSQLFQSIAYPAPSCQYRSNFQAPNRCESGFISILRYTHENQWPLASWMNSWEGGLCPICKAELKRRYEEARTRLWNDLPLKLGLSCWNDLDKDGEIP